MDRFEILTDTHKIQVADHDQDQKWTFEKNHSYDGQETSIGVVSKITHSTKELAITANSFEDVTTDDVPEELFDFLDSEGYHTDYARRITQL